LKEQGSKEIPAGNRKTMSDMLASKLSQQLEQGGVVLPDENLAFKGKK